MKKLLSVLSIISTLFLLIGCGKSVIFDEKELFPDANWAFENKAVTFKAPLTASEKPLAVILELELIETPNVDKFFATFTMVTPKGAKTIKSLLFNFISPQEPYIQGSKPNEKIYKLVVYPEKYFSETGEYSFEVNQFSNNADNYGIRSLRLFIETVKK
jgi:hypothetical protein